MLLLVSLSAFTLTAGNIRYMINEADKEVVIFPNPVLDKEFSIKSDKKIEEVVVLNIVGQPVFTQRYLDQRNVSIELETSDKGVFIVQVKTSDGTIRTKRILLK